MKIAYVAAGAAGMVCGSCIHDNTLAAALGRRGHDVALIPTYTPLRTDEHSVSLPRVFYGAVNVYLQQKTGFFRHTPRWLDRLLDRPWLLNWVSRFAASTDAKDLGELTLSVLRGEKGLQAKELERLVTFMRDDFKPDLVHITNSMFLGLVRRLKEEMPGVPVVVSVQGEDIFLEDLPQPFKGQVFDELRQRAKEPDLFLAPSTYYAEFMAEVLAVEDERMRVVPLGLSLDAHRAPLEPRAPAQTVGYLARICPEKGLHNLVDAVALVAERGTHPDLALAVAGWLGERDRAYFEGIERQVKERGLEERFRFVGEVDLDGKVRFLRSLDVLSVPTVYHEPKGLYVLEALANGVPVVEPRHGAFGELVEATGGGLLVEPDDPAALAEGLARMLDDPQRQAMGLRGRRAVFERYSDEAMAAATLEVYEALIERAAGGAVAAMPC